MRIRGLCLVVAVLTLTLFVVAPDDASAQDPVTGEHGYLDQANRAYIMAQWNPEGPGFGGFILVIDGLGAILADDGLSVTNSADGGLQVAFQGTAPLDPGATFDPVFGWNFALSAQPSVPASVILSGTISPDGVVADFQIDVDGTPYTLQTTPLVHDAERVADEILTLFVEQDWSAIYSRMYSGFRQGISEQDFIDEATAGTRRHGAIVRFEPAKGFSYSAQPGTGHRAATGYVFLLNEHNGVVAREKSAMTLIREDHAWKVLSIDRPEFTVTLTNVEPDGPSATARIEASGASAEFAFIGDGESYVVRIVSADAIEGTVEIVGSSTTQWATLVSGEASIALTAAEGEIVEVIVELAPGSTGDVTVQISTEAALPPQPTATPADGPGEAAPTPSPSPATGQSAGDGEAGGGPALLWLGAPLVVALGAAVVWVRRRSA